MKEPQRDGNYTPEKAIELITQLEKVAKDKGISFQTLVRDGLAKYALTPPASPTESASDTGSNK